MCDIAKALRSKHSFFEVMHCTGLSMKELEEFVIKYFHSLDIDDSLLALEDKFEDEQSSDDGSEDEQSCDDGCMDKIELSDEQQEFLNLVLTGNSIFLTASAGYGKSAALEHAVRELRRLHDHDPMIPSKIAITASTGKAAGLIGGRTVHSYLGVGLARLSAEKLYEKLMTVSRMKKKRRELMQLKTLIIDEISMINAAFLDKISSYLALIKCNNEPFGGVQMVFVGDLLQLPPVEGKFMIEANAYKQLNPIVIQLTKCFRQSDKIFQEILSEARFGNLSDKSYEILLAQNEINREKFDPDAKPMLICSTNKEVDAINQRELARINEPIVEYEIIPIDSNMRKIELAASSEAIPLVIKLKIGAQIVITTNVSLGTGLIIANGTQGFVREMHEKHIIVELFDMDQDVKIAYHSVLDPDIIDEDLKPVYIFEYLPIKLGYAMTIHKCQGMTCSLLEIDLSKVFADGQAYVAVSRVKSLDGLKLIGLKRNAFKANKFILRFYQRYT